MKFNPLAARQKSVQAAQQVGGQVIGEATIISSAASIPKLVEPEGSVILFAVSLFLVCRMEAGYANSPLAPRLFIAQPIPLAVAIPIWSADLGRLWRPTFRRRRRYQIAGQESSALLRSIFQRGTPSPPVWRANKGFRPRCQAQISGCLKV